MAVQGKTIGWSNYTGAVSATWRSTYDTGKTSAAKYPTIYVFGDETLSKWESDLRMPLLPNKMTLKDFDTLIGLLNEWSKNNPLDSKSLNGNDVSVIKKYIKDNYLSTGKGEANAESDSKKAGIVGIRA